MGSEGNFTYETVYVNKIIHENMDVFKKRGKSIHYLGMHCGSWPRRKSVKGADGACSSTHAQVINLEWVRISRAARHHSSYPSPPPPPMNNCYKLLPRHIQEERFKLNSHSFLLDFGAGRRAERWSNPCKVREGGPRMRGPGSWAYIQYVGPGQMGPRWPEQCDR